VLASAHHEYLLTLGVNGPLVPSGHHPTAFESGKWKVAQDLVPLGYKATYDAIWLNNFKLVPFSNGYAHTLQ
jgi:hypothetical protein